MILNTGEILGSNSNRLQLADSSSNPQKLPGDGSTDILVLQGRYVQLFNSDGTKQIGTRAYVQNYDSSYGHIYPISGSFTEDMINSANQVRFYKYTNNENSVLPGDVVKCASTSNVRTESECNDAGGTLPQTSAGYTISNMGTLNQKITTDGQYLFTCTDGSTNTWTYGNSQGPVVVLSDYGITLNVAPSTNDTIKFDYTRFTSIIDNIPVDQGDLVLLKDQTNAKENGVYIVDTGAKWGRSASYDQWGEFIGKIIFVQQGHDNGGKNFQSQAKAGGTLSNPASGTLEGDSPLYFNEEQPIVVYPDLIKNTATYANQILPTRINDKYEVDGYIMQNGETVFVANDGYIYQLNEVSGVISLDPILTNPIDVCNITLGKEYGNKTVRRSSGDFVIDYSSQTCYILRNTQSRTYVKPYTGITPNMILYLQNNQYVTTVNNQDINYLKINLVNTKFWYIEHDMLNSGLSSIVDKTLNTPYKYEIRSYFKQSDENPFTLYSDPYIKLAAPNGEGGSNLTIIQDYHVDRGNNNSEYVIF